MRREKHVLLKKNINENVQEMLIYKIQNTQDTKETEEKRWKLDNLEELQQRNILEIVNVAPKTSAYMLCEGVSTSTVRHHTIICESIK